MVNLSVIIQRELQNMDTLRGTFSTTCCGCSRYEQNECEHLPNHLYVISVVVLTTCLHLAELDLNPGTAFFYLLSEMAKYIKKNSENIIFSYMSTFTINTFFL